MGGKLQQMIDKYDYYSILSAIIISVTHLVLHDEQFLEMKYFKEKEYENGSRLLGCSKASSFLFYSSEAMRMMIFLHDERDFKFMFWCWKNENYLPLKILTSFFFLLFLQDFSLFFLSSFYSSSKIIYMLVLLVEANVMSFILILLVLLYVNALLESIV